MDFVQLIFRGHGHATDGLSGILLIKKSAVANHKGSDARVSTVEKGLQSTARHASHTDVLRINLLEIGRSGIFVLSQNPVDALNLLFGS